MLSRMKVWTACGVGCCVKRGPEQPASDAVDLQDGAFEQSRLRYVLCTVYCVDAVR